MSGPIQDGYHNRSAILHPGLRDDRATEYRVMRETIRDRGTARMVLLPIVFIGWAAIAVATTHVITVALGMLVPLVVLVAGFEAIFALHLNVERIGRYLQAFHEDAEGWEHVAMRYGRRFPGSGPVPLYGRLFILATSVNYLPAALGGTVPEQVVLAALHFVFINRVRVARGFAARQRAEDLERFESLKSEIGNLKSPSKETSFPPPVPPSDPNA